MIIGELDEIVGNLGTRDRFADVVATIADLLEVNWFGSGESFAKNILVPGD